MSTDLREWIGRTETRTDRITPAPMAGLSATLDRDDAYPQAGDALPPLWHWLYFLPHEPQSGLGPEGHPVTGGFLPPSPLPRRMWAGGRLEFAGALRVGDAVTRRSRIVDVVGKEGRSGTLLFVVVEHEISNDDGVAIREEHDIVYRGAAGAGDPAPAARSAPSDESWTRRIDPDDVLLFRYSALTFNAHRIHYDRRYATEIEGYPGLVVHGPFIATLLVDLLRRRRPDADVSRFVFKAVHPLFDTGPFWVCGRPGDDEAAVRLWAKDADGRLAVEAEAGIRGA